MSRIPNELLCYFTAEITEEDGKYIIEIPDTEVEVGTLDLESTHNVAVFGSENEREAQDVVPSEAELGSGDAPPVREGEKQEITLTDTGSEGDGIAKINDGYVIIVPDGVVGETYEIEIIAVHERFAVGEPIGEN